MKLLFNPSKLALALSATFVSSRSSTTNVDANVGVNQLVDDEKEESTIAPQLPSIQVVSSGANFVIDNSAYSSNSASSLFQADVVDVGVLRRNLKRNTKNQQNLLFSSDRRTTGGRGGGRSRSLQNVTTATTTEETELPNCLKPDTCEPSLCACTAGGGVAYDCAAELNAVCNNVTATNGMGNANNGTLFTIKGCVAKGYADYYYNLYCPFAKCVVDGGTENECFCEFYGTSCEIYDIRKYKDDIDHLQMCAGEKCCAGKTDDASRETCFADTCCDAETCSPDVAPYCPKEEVAAASDAPLSRLSSWGIVAAATIASIAAAAVFMA